MWSKKKMLKMAINLAPSTLNEPNENHFFFWTNFGLVLFIENLDWMPFC